MIDLFVLRPNIKNGNATVNQISAGDGSTLCFAPFLCTMPCRHSRKSDSPFLNADLVFFSKRKAFSKINDKSSCPLATSSLPIISHTPYVRAHDQHTLIERFQHHQGHSFCVRCQEQDVEVRHQLHRVLSEG